MLIPVFRNPKLVKSSHLLLIIESSKLIRLISTSLFKLLLSLKQWLKLNLKKRIFVLLDNALIDL